MLHLIPKFERKTGHKGELFEFTLSPRVCCAGPPTKNADQEISGCNLERVSLPVARGSLSGALGANGTTAVRDKAIFEGNA